MLPGRPTILWRFFLFVLPLLGANVLYHFINVKGLYVSVLFVYSHDISVGAFLIIGALFATFSENNNLKLELRPMGAFAYVLFTGGLLIVVAFRGLVSVNIGYVASGVLIGLLKLTVMGFSFCVFMSPKVLAMTMIRNWKSVAIGGTAIAVLFLQRESADMLWPFLMRPTGNAVYYLLRAVGFRVVFRIAGMNEAVALFHDDYLLRIYSICGGLEAVCIFVFGASLFYILYVNEIRTNWWILYGKGIFLMFFVNTLLIASIFALGVWIRDHFSDSASTVIVADLFHSSIGFVLYVGTTVLFFVRIIIRNEATLATRTVKKIGL